MAQLSRCTWMSRIVQWISIEHSIVPANNCIAWDNASASGQWQLISDGQLSFVSSTFIPCRAPGSNATRTRVVRITTVSSHFHKCNQQQKWRHKRQRCRLHTNGIAVWKPFGSSRPMVTGHSCYPGNCIAGVHCGQPLSPPLFPEQMTLAHIYIDNCIQHNEPTEGGSRYDCLRSAPNTATTCTSANIYNTPCGTPHNQAYKYIFMLCISMWLRLPPMRWHTSDLQESRNW